MPHLHTVSVGLYVRVGSRFESAADNGLSHFLEHMCFRGTDQHPTSFDLNYAVERLGATLHAETGRAHSLFQLSVAPDGVEDALALLGEVISRQRFSDIDLEREIILEELSEDYDEKGVEICAEEIVRRLAFAGHPLQQRITGPRGNVERFTVDDLSRHRARFYGARNLILGIAGPIDPDAALAATERILGSLPAGERAEAVPYAVRTGAPQRSVVSNPGSQTDVHLGYVGVSETHPLYMAQHAMLRVLDDGMSTRLHHRVCDQRGLAYSVGASVEPLHDVSLIEVEGSCAHGKVGAMLDAFFALMDELRREPVSAAELDKLKLRYRRDVDAMLDDPGAMVSWYAGTELHYEPPSLRQRVADVDAITTDDILEVARMVVRPEHLTVVVIGSAKSRAIGDVMAKWAAA